MPNPSISDVHVSQLLTNISVAFQLDQSDYIADKVFPVVPVQKQADKYWTYPRGVWFRDEAVVRAPATESVGGGWTLSTDSYYADVYAWHSDLDDQTRANADSVLQLESDATRFVTTKLLLKRETLWIATYFKTGVWGVDVTGVAAAPTGSQVLQWNDSASTPVQDMELWRLYMRELTGYMPNTLVVGPRVIQALKDHPDLIDRIKYTQRGFVTEDLLAAVFGVDRVLTPYATKNTAVEGAADSFSFLYGKGALLCYVAPSAGMRNPSAGYTFAWTGLLGSSALGGRIKRFRMEAIESDRVEGEMAFDQKVVAPELGIYFTALVA